MFLVAPLSQNISYEKSLCLQLVSLPKLVFLNYLMTKSNILYFGISDWILKTFRWEYRKDGAGVIWEVSKNILVSTFDVLLWLLPR